MKAQFPFKVPYQITQGFFDNANNYPGGHHGALDIVPLQNGQPFPAEIFPLFDGSEISIQDTDPVKGKGVKERVLLDDDFYAYLMDKGLAKPVSHGERYLDILYWHMLDVTDKDGQLSDGTPIGHAGNTGDVWHGGVAVPNDQKGVPPYLGLHLHMSIQVYTDNFGTLNLDKDIDGRIDPQVVFAYKEEAMHFQLESDGKTVTLCSGVNTKKKTGFATDLAGLQAMFGDENISLSPDPNFENVPISGIFEEGFFYRKN